MNKANTALILIGAPGSGKTSFCKIGRECAFQHFSSSDILKEHGNGAVRRMIDAGELVPDSVSIPILRSFMASIRPGDAIFDGFFRTSEQVEKMFDALEEFGSIKTVLMDVTFKEAERRLLIRAQKEGRRDDSSDRIKYRMRQYVLKSLPALALLTEKTELVTIDNMIASEDVAKAMWDFFHEQHDNPVLACAS